MLDVKLSDVDLLHGLIPTDHDVTAYLAQSLDVLLARTGCPKACILLPRGPEGRLELALGRDARGQLQAAWPDVCRLSLSEALQSGRACEVKGLALAVPVAHMGEILGALYLSLEGCDISPSRRELSEGVASQIGLVLANSRAAWDRDQALRRLNDEQADNTALRARVDELERLNEDLRHFAHFASHDLHEPLRAVTGYCGVVEQTATQLDPQTHRYLEQIRAATARMSKLLHDLLDYTQLGESNWTLQRVNCADVLHYVRLELEGLIREARARIEREELGWVTGDPVALRLLFKALLSNALKFRRGSHPLIEVGSTRFNNSHTRLWIKDDGIGIPQRHLNEVFRPFRRLHALDEYSGNGLGLSMARRIVERLGGRIWIEPNPEFGVTVFFELPDRPWGTP